MLMDLPYVHATRVYARPPVARRPAALHLVASVHATFEVEHEVDEALAGRLFSQPHIYPAWVRFSGDGVEGSAGAARTCGIEIELFGVERLWGRNDVARDFTFLATDEVSAGALDVAYESAFPTCVDDGRVVRYELVPDGLPVTREDRPFVLGEDLHARLREADARFRFVAHVRAAAGHPAADDACEHVHLATLVIPRQDPNANAYHIFGDDILIDL